MNVPARREALPWLCGARLQRIDGPVPDVFALTLFAQGIRESLVLALGKNSGVGSALERPKGAAANAFVQRLRTRLENARVIELSAFLSDTHAERMHAFELTLERNGETSRLLVDFSPKKPALLVLAEDRHILFAEDERALRERGIERKAPYEPDAHGRTVPLARDANELRALGTRLLAHTVSQAEETRKRQALALLNARRKRVERKVEAIRGDVERAAQAPLLRRKANALLCHLSEITRGTASVELLDESVDPPELLEITLAPDKGPSDNANALFERAKKLDRGIVIAQARLRETEAELAEITREIEAVEAGSPSPDANTRKAGVQLALTTPEPRKKRAQEHIAFRTFDSPHGRILVGKGAIDNDTLTLTVARPHDYWLHARSVHGAHVVVPLQKGAKIDPELLLDAAHLAAHFSDARGEAQVEIQHTERRYIRKGKGSAPGAVNLDREKVLLLRVIPSRITQLLACEQR